MMKLVMNWWTSMLNLVMRKCAWEALWIFMHNTQHGATNQKHLHCATT